MTPAVIWFDGRLIRPSDATISPLDHGITVGDGVFETLLVDERRPFAWRRHLQRLRASADGLGIPLPDDAVLISGATALIERLALDTGRLRITVTAGVGPPGSGPAIGPPTVFMVAVPVEVPIEPADLVISPWTRNPGDATTGLKTTSYAGNVRALADAHARDAGEALFLTPDGRVCETTGSNIFVVRDGAALTPPLSSGCLAGVTRSLLLERAHRYGIDAAEVELTADELFAADEAFLCSTIRIVQAVGHVDGRRIGDETGQIAATLREAFVKEMATDPNP